MNFFSRLFGRKEKPAETSAALIKIPNGTISQWYGNSYANDIYRAGVDAIARNGAKLKAVHAVTHNGQKKISTDKRLERLLQVSPNQYMTAYDFLYKLITQMYLTNNAFALLDRDDGGILRGVYPIGYSSVEMLMDELGTLYAKFRIRNGRQVQFQYRDLIHIRRHFNNSDFLGEDNRAIDAALEVAHVQNEGIVNSIKNSATLRGILKFAQVLPDEKLRDAKTRFMEDYLSIGNEGGVVAVDQQLEYLPIESKPVSISGEQSALIRDKIYSYLGISQSIVDSTYSEDQFAAFYESVIEPIATALSLEFTRKLFNEREQSFGNQIIFESGRLQFSSNRTKIELLKELMPLGLLTVNQALEVLNLAPVEGGERRLQTLNVVDADRATEYQLAKAYNGGRNGVMENGISTNGNDGDNGNGDETRRLRDSL